MSKELVEASGSVVSLGKNAIKEMKDQRALLRKFVESQLVEANFKDPNSTKYGEGDFGIIPGTKKRTLLKPGAEKIMRLFNLGARFKLVDKEVDRYANFALYTYEVEIYSLRSGIVVATCQGTANSQEDKYKEKTEYQKNEKGVKVAVKVEMPIFNLLNTLQKMAQKRALVGGVILATGASEYFTQDMIDGEEALEAQARDVSEAGSPFTKPAPKGVKKEVDPEIEVQAPPTPPVCCGKEMMISRYVDSALGHAPWYCMQCKKKLPAIEAS